MADDTADFYLRLHEEVNAPAKRARQAVQQLSGGLVAAQKELSRTESALTSLYRRQAQAPRLEAEKRSHDLRRAGGLFAGAVGGGIFGGEAGHILGGIAGGELGMIGAGAAIAASAVTTVIDLAKEAASAVAGIAVSFAKTTAEAVDFEQRSKLAFGFLIGDANKGAEQFEAVRQEAVGLGLDVHNTVDSFRQLLAAQFTIEQSHSLVKLGADMQALGADAEHVQRIMYALSEIKSIGTLQQRQVRMLQMAGISGELINKALMGKLGVTSVEQVKARQKKGGIGADMAIEAIQEAVMHKAHESALGQAGTTFANVKISGMLNQASGMIDNWFISLGERLEPAATRLTSRIFGLFKDLAGSPELSNFADFVVTEFQNIESWTREHWPEIADTAKQMFRDTLDGAEELWGNIKGLFTADNIETFKQSLKDLPNTVWMLVEPFVALAKALAAIASFAKDFNQWNDDLGDSVGKLLQLDTKFGREVLGYESNADRKKRESGAALGGNPYAAALSGASAGALPAGKSVTIGQLSVPIQVINADGKDPKELNADIDKRIQTNLLMMLDQAS